MTARLKFINALKSSGLNSRAKDFESLVSENLISPFVVELPLVIKTQAQEMISGLYELRETAEYQEFYKNELEQKGLKDPGNKSIAMSYDVHWDKEQQKIKLIEINTNAAFLFLSLPLYTAAQLPPAIPDFSLAQLIQCFEKEIQLSSHQKSTRLEGSRKVAIIDEVPEQQKLFIEFLFAQNVLQFHGWDCEILDYRQVDLEKFDFIYNRYTDFYLDRPESQHLRKSFLSGKPIFSPNPYEYCLLADKQRMIDWHQEKFWSFSSSFKKFKSIVENYVPHAEAFSDSDLDTIWQDRKKYFFKPKNSFGSKMSYRGSSISRKLFDSLPHAELLRQEFVPAPEESFTTPNGPVQFKYDLRLYAYQGQLQNVVARLYQGQVTNLQTPYGGFACVKWL